MCFRFFNLGPRNYYTAPGFAWDALLLLSDARLAPLTGEDMYIFFEKGIRGGYSNIHKCYSKANHKYLDDFDPEQISKYLIYWDFNSMYATAMLQPMPYSHFKWAKPEDIKLIEKFIRDGDYHKIPPCTLNVDLQHNVGNLDKEKVFAMCPDVYKEDGVKKLSHHLYDKNNHVIHHRLFKKFLKEGMEVKRVNQVVFYREKTWIRDYIEFCVEQRTIATQQGNKFLKEFFKLMCNAVFGKSMENVCNRVNFKLVNDKKQLQKELNKPTPLDTTICDSDSLVGVHLKKGTIMLDKPIYTGQYILDESKLMMYEFMYDYVFKNWGVDNARLCMTDTDSVLLEIKTDDLYKDIERDVPRWFDTAEMVRTQFGETTIKKMN